MAIKENDFIELEYTGKTTEDNIIFDTTDEKIAKENNLERENTKFQPITICVGQGHLIKGLDKELIGKELNKPYHTDIKAEEAYGKKETKLIQLISTAKFTKQNIQPMPGLSLNIDGMMGVIKTVSGGRTLVDFNHPLAGKDLSYDFKINKIITDDQEKAKALMKLNLGIEPKIETKDNKTIMTMEQKLPDEVKTKIIEDIKAKVPNLKNITIQEEQKKEESLNTSKPSTENKE